MKAYKLNHQHNISPFINSGYITCVIESNNNNIYYGTNIVTGSKIAMCAEKSAISSMVSNQDYIIKRMVLVNELGELLLPCENCLEYLLDFSDQEGFEVLTAVEKGKTVNIHDLLPDYWGTFRASKED